MRSRCSLVVAAVLLALAPPAAFAQRATPVQDAESLLNAARRDAEAGQLDSAIATYERSLAIINGPLLSGLDAAGAARWRAYDSIVRFNLATLHAAKGADYFQLGDLDGAIGSFRTSLHWNPYSRDIRYNLCQAMYIQASRLKDYGGGGDLTAIYTEVLAEGEKVRSADPANANLLLVLAHSYRGVGNEERAAALFTESAGLGFEIGEVRMEVGAAETRLAGVLRNLRSPQGSPVRLRFSILSLSGRLIAASEVEMATPAAGRAEEFALKIATSEDVAGWRYEVVPAGGLRGLK